jgi:hypothetical protein
MDSIRASEALDPGSIPGVATTKSRPERALDVFYFSNVHSNVRNILLNVFEHP